MIGQFSDSYTDPRMYELDALIRAEPKQDGVYCGASKPGPKPGQICNGLRKRQMLDQVAERMRRHRDRKRSKAAQGLARHA